jgi:3-oxoacyl-[acyl-carrier protein] reductase
MHPDIENKVAVITGGSRGIGFRIAETLLENGASVVIGARKEADVRRAVETLNQKRGNRAEGAAVDVRDYGQVEQLMALAERKFGGIDILVNNAGIGVFRPVDELTPEEWDAVIGTNLNGAFYCVRAAVARMKRRGGGYIFNISSLAGKNAFAGGAAYNASKSGLNAFSEALMLDVRYDNIRVSYIMPGSVETSFGHPDGPEAAKPASWKIDAQDVAQVVVDLLKSEPRTMLSRVEMRPSKPPRK